ncbi:hypothetical protein ADL03_17100 [Nocardia sp. NRRL S-836]|nr:hypothetical protein ADL03_17100 [Nocardia sp. NRRL S-836]
MGESLDLHWAWWVGGFGVALAWAVASGFLARSPKPWASAVRLFGWALLWCAEPFVAVPLLGVVAAATNVAVASILYVAGALGFGYHLLRRYRRKA